MRSRAFSLLELVVVVVILGVIGAIAVPRVSGFAARSKVSAASASVRMIQKRIIEEEAAEGRYPSAIDPDWFSAGEIPPNPFEKTSPRSVQVVKAGASVTEPVNKTVGSGRSAYWYNMDNGSFRARVAAQGSTGATVALYNEVNGTTLTDESDVDITDGTLSKLLSIGG